MNTLVLSAPKILVVDDRQENLLAIEAALSEQGYDLISVTSGFEAVSRVMVQEFAAVLLDVQMPGIDGFETARRIRAIDRGRTIPIIFVTAIHRSEEFEQRGYIAGAVDYLFKPLNVEILRAKLSVFVELQRQREAIRIQAEMLQVRAIKERETDFLREALHTRDEFLSMAAHELKTPITPLNLQMQTFLKLVEDGTLRDVEPERLKRMLETAYGQVQRLARTIDELLDVSRISTGKLQLTFTPIDLGAMVTDVVRQFSPELSNVGCEVVLDIEPNVLSRCDAFRIEQVVINLLSNCMRYAGGKPIFIRVLGTVDSAQIEVRDHGVGISHEDQKRIFDRFERATSSRHHAGMGLGLYIAKELVQLHQGTIEVVSQPGEGSLFRVLLPRAEVNVREGVTQNSRSTEKSDGGRHAERISEQVQR